MGSLSRRELSLLLAAGAASLALPPPASGQPPATAPEPDPAVDAAVETESTANAHITAPVSINGLGPFRFLVDTGANRSCISRTLAAQLALTPGPRTPVNTVFGERLQPSVRIDRLQVGARTQRRVTAPILAMQSMGVDGVLGVDWLKGQRLSLGLAEGRLEIGRSRRDSNGPGRVVVPARQRSGQLTMVDADIGGRPVSAIIDTGSQVTLINAHLRPEADRARAAGGAGPVHINLISIVGERRVGELHYLPFMRVGGVMFGNVPAVFANAHVFDLWGLRDKPAVLLGMDLLNEFEAVTLDFGRSAVRFDLAEGVETVRRPARPPA